MVSQFIIKNLRSSIQKTADFKQEILSVKTLIQHAIEPLMIPLEIKEQQFNRSRRTSAKIVGDFHWTVEALTIFLKNAIEHTPVCGTIQVNIQKKSDLYRDYN